MKEHLTKSTKKEEQFESCSFVFTAPSNLPQIEEEHQKNPFLTDQYFIGIRTIKEALKSFFAQAKAYG